MAWLWRRGERLWRLLRRDGIRGLLRRLAAGTDRPSYAAWLSAHRLTDEERRAICAEIAAWPAAPLISVIVPVHNTPAAWLRACLDSVLAQFYPHWELCIADDASTAPHVRAILAEYAARDPRVKVIYRTENGHVCAATNSALELATGEFVVFLDHDDTLEPHALHLVAHTLDQHPDASLVYSDHDRLDLQERPCEPRFKPGWSPDLLLGGNYINHLTVLRTELVRAAGGVRPGLEGAQDHDLLLRTTAQLAPGQIQHIPHVLYHWRKHPASISGDPRTEARALVASRRAVTEAARRVCPDAQVEDVPGAPFIHRIRYPVQEPAPLVSVIIPTRDRLNLLRPCLEGLQAHTSYPAIEIIVVDNGSREPATVACLAEFARQPRRHVLACPGPFNYSALNNAGANVAAGDVLCFLNNDIVVQQAGWLRELVSHALRPEVGAVGPLLRYPDGRVQHGGIVLGDRVLARLAFHQARGEPPPSAYQLRRVRNVAALTGACLVMRRSVFAEVGGFDAQLAVAHNDTDLCLALRAAGYWLVFTPFAELIHLHSASRGPDTTHEQRTRLHQEAAYLRAKWGAEALVDPFLNPNTHWQGARLELNFPARAQQPWRQGAQ